MTLPVTGPGRVQEVRWASEATPGAAIAAPATYWNAGYSNKRVWDVQPEKLVYGADDDPSTAYNSFEDRPRILTAKGGQLPFKTHLVGLNQQAADTAALTQEAEGNLLAAAMGGESLGKTTKAGAASGPGASSNLVVASTTSWAVGQYLCWNGYVRRVTAVVDATHLTLDMDLPASPAQNDLIIGAANYYLDETALTDLSQASHVTFAALARGLVSTDQYQARGCFPEIAALSGLGPRMLAVIEFILHAQSWELVTGIAAIAPPATIGVPAQIASGLWMQSAGVTTSTQLAINSVAISLGLKPVPVYSPSAEQGTLGHIVAGGRTTLEIEPNYSDASWNTAFESRTVKYGGYQIGKPSTATGAVAIGLPNMTIDDTPPIGHPKDKQTLIKPKLHADYNSGGATTLAKSRVVIALFPHL